MSFGIYYDGLACCADPRSRYVRQRGVNHSVSKVYIPADRFGELVARFDRNRFEDLPSGAGLPALVERINSPTPLDDFEGRSRLPYKADLVLVRSQAKGDEAHLLYNELTARDLFLVEARIDDSLWEPPVIELTLADVRLFWSRFGELTGRWNVRRADGSLVPFWSRDRGETPIPLKEILQDVLNALPGRCRIVRFPALGGIEPPDVRCWGARPYDVLGGIMSHFGLELDIGPDLRARFFRRGEGEVGELIGEGTADNFPSYDPATHTGAWTSQVPASGRNWLPAPAHDSPPEVVVIGARTVFSVYVDRLEPVIYRTVVDPNTLEPRQQIIDVSPFNLERLVRGEFDPEEPGTDTSDWDDIPAQRAKATNPTELVATPPTLAELADAVLNRKPKVTTLRSPYYWLKYPLIGPGSVMRRASRVAANAENRADQVPGLPGEDLPTQVRKLLDEQLWRFYRVPEQYRRLLPILDRAETSPLGKRLPPVLFAFGFEEIVTIEPPAEVPPQDYAESLRYRNELEDLKFFLEGLRRRLTAPTLSEIEAVLRRDNSFSAREARTMRRLWLEFAGGRPGPGPSGDELTSEETAISVVGKIPGVGPLVKFAYEVTEPLFTKETGGAPGDADPTAMAKYRAALRKMALEFVESNFGVKLENADEAVLAAVNQYISQTESKIREVNAEINPAINIQNKLAGLEVQAANERKATGRELASTRAAIDDALLELLAAEAADADRRDKHREPKAVTSYRNLPRRRVPFRVVDAANGVIEVLGDLPMWLADEAVPFAENTFALPMFCALWFGSHNRTDEELRTGLTPNVFLQKMGETLALHPELYEGVHAPIGTVLPKVQAETQLRLRFSRNDPTSGEAKIGPHPYPIVDPDMRLLVRVNGKTNANACLARALPQALGVMGPRLESRDAGTVEVLGPRAVALNGRITATEVFCLPADEGSAFTLCTRVSFDSDVAPLPGVFGDIPEDGPARLVFGLDVDAEEAA